MRVLRTRVDNGRIKADQRSCAGAEGVVTVGLRYDDYSCTGSPYGRMIVTVYYTVMRPPPVRCMGGITRRHRWLRRPVRRVKDWRPRIERYQLAFAGWASKFYSVQ